MGFLNLGDATYWESIGANLSGSTGTDVTSGGSADTKGSWVQLKAATTNPIDDLWLYASSIASRKFLFDIGIGAASSEIVLIANISFDARFQRSHHWRFPIQIPAGTRVSARAQASVASQIIQICATGRKRATHLPIGFQRVQTFGADTANTRGTTIDPGGTPSTKGAWVQFSASIPYSIRHIVMSNGGDGNNTINSANWLQDVGVGGAGSEVVIIGDSVAGNDLLSDTITYNRGNWDVQIPAGSRIAMRCESTDTDATDRLLYPILHGLS